MTRWEIIQSLIDKINAKKYLEIGVHNGQTFYKIKVKNKVGVDPDKNSRATINLTSDDFFSSNKDIYDVIFIDGLHHADQVEKDIRNSLKSINKNGYIVCHDMLPSSFETQVVPRQQDAWTGDCWKAWVNLRSKEHDLTMRVVNTDHGCGVITYGRQELIKLDEEQITYDNFVKNKQDWMNIISIDEFKEIYLNE